jgi:hypothetical protein
MLNQLTAIHDMARLYDIRSILGMNSNKRVIVCPLPQHKHQHNTPSFSIFTTPDRRQKWVCHGSCNQSGDAIDLIGFLKIPGYDKRSGEHVKAALALLAGSTPINPPRPETTKKPQLPNGLYKRYLPAGNEVLTYAQKRFLTSETLQRFSIGQHCSGIATWMTMPTLHGEQLRGIKMRNLNSTSKKDRYSNVPGSVNGLFNYNGVAKTSQPVLIVKGEIAAMILGQFGILACAPTGGEGAYYKHEELLMPLAFSARRVVVADNDNRPDVREKMVSAALRRAEIFKAELRIPPDPHVGVDDWVIAQPEIAIPTIKSWME